jgi:hypothetical protein
MAVPPISKAGELDTPGPLRWPADPGDDAQLDHGGMGVSEDHNDSHEPHGAPHQGTDALGSYPKVSSQAVEEAPRLPLLIWGTSPRARAIKRRERQGHRMKV